MVVPVPQGNVEGPAELAYVAGRATGEEAELREATAFTISNKQSCLSGRAGAVQELQCIILSGLPGV